MKETRLIIPELGLIAGTRAALGGRGCPSPCGQAHQRAAQSCRLDTFSGRRHYYDSSGDTGVCEAPLTRGREIAARISC